MPTPNHETVLVTCPHCGWALADPLSRNIRTEWKSHLVTHRNDPTFSLDTLPDSFFSATSLHPCLQCNSPSNGYVSATNLTSHTCCTHSSSHSHLNSQILLDLFPDLSWSDALTWLQTLEISPPPFRHNFFHHLTASNKQLAYHSTHLLCKAISQATVPVSDDLSDKPPAKTSSDPLWKLLFLLQALLFCPYHE